MTQRPLFVPGKIDGALVEIVNVDFKWVAGMALVQKQKSICSLHESAKKYGFSNILEASRRSELELGTNLSAFNLTVSSSSGKKIPVECIFQSSKVFRNGGPFRDLLYVTPREAKKFELLKTSGPMLRFEDKNGTEWPLDPPSLYYDWVYINALNLNPELSDAVMEYDAFTDIEFNPTRQLNCQAGSVALFVSLKSRGLLAEALSSKAAYIELIKRNRSRI